MSMMHCPLHGSQATLVVCRERLCAHATQPCTLTLLRAGRRPTRSPAAGGGRGRAAGGGRGGRGAAADQLLRCADPVQAGALWGLQGVLWVLPPLQVGARGWLWWLLGIFVAMQQQCMPCGCRLRAQLKLIWGCLCCLAQHCASLQECTHSPLCPLAHSSPPTWQLLPTLSTSPPRHRASDANDPEVMFYCSACGCRADAHEVDSVSGRQQARQVQLAQQARQQ